MKPAERDRALDFWIRASEFDEWTFEHLRDLFGNLIDSGDMPPALQAWANEFTARRRQAPTRRGPKNDPAKDFKTMADVVLRSEFKGMSLRQAYREVGKEINRSPEAVESAVRRGRQWPPGA